jgi:predicted transcriptional regulator
VPVNEVADQLGVTRMTVYNWFWGECEPSASMAERIESYMTSLRK